MNRWQEADSKISPWAIKANKKNEYRFIFSNWVPEELVMFTKQQYEDIREALRQFDGVNGYQMNTILDIAIQYTKKPKYRMKTVDELVAEGGVLRETNMATYIGLGNSNMNLLEVVKNQIAKKIFDKEYMPRYREFFVEIKE